MHPFLDDAFLFDWSRLRPEHVEPDIREALRRAQANVEAFKALPPGRLTYDDVLLGLERSTRELSRAWGLVTHLDAVMNSEPLRKAHNALLPEVTAFFTSLTLDPQVWSVIRDYAGTPEAAALTGVRRRFLEETAADFVENGADLPPDSKQRLAAINADLASR
ncbi:MAG: M3 family peptidase, partial [Verrucomicrobiota bacterium]